MKTRGRPLLPIGSIVVLLATGPLALAQIGPPGTSRPGGIANPMSTLPASPSLNGRAPGSTSFHPGLSAPGLTMSQAESALLARGFTSVHILQHSGNTYTGIANRNGRTVPVTIDANTGEVIER